MMSTSSVESREDIEPPRAYSYVRFSSPKQAEGFSLQRQRDKAAAYAAENGLELDTELKLQDLGVSAFRSLNAKTGALSIFLRAVQDGIVPVGSHLLVENIDRLTRDDIPEAAGLFLSIIGAGITVVTLTNGYSYSRQSLKDLPYEMMQIVMELIRANQESTLKSTRVSDAYDRKRRLAAQGDKSKPFTRALPAWLEWSEETKGFVVIPERAAVIHKVFSMADGGLGQQLIAERLNKEGVLTFERRGNHRKAGAWHRSYVQRLLTNSALVGTFTPHLRGKDKRKPVPQDPVENYFPKVIEHELFERVASRARAAAPRGRHATVETKSVFAGLSKCAHCGGPFTRMLKSPNNVYLVCSRANRRITCKLQAVRYDHAEQALRDNARVIVEEAPRGLATEEIEAEIANSDVAVGEIGDDVRDLTDELIRDKSNAVRTRLREKEREYEEARESLRELRVRRDRLTKDYVTRRLKAVEQTLTQKPFSVVAANRALKEAVSQIVVNPEEGTLQIHWHHAELPTDVPFYSKHQDHGFEAVEGGYVFKRPKRRKGGNNNNGDGAWQQ
jgi:DNA invertase Pin-like site-specific DNA recombinase